MMMNDVYILQPPRILCTVTTILFLLSASTTTAASAWLPSSSLLLLPRKPHSLLPSSSQPQLRQHSPIFSSSQHQELDDDENTNHHSNSGCHIDIDNQLLLDGPIRGNVLHSPQRRRFWSQRVLPTLFAGLSSSLPTQLLPAAAATIFGEANLPTEFKNRIMEQIRIWEQDEADQMQYHGELERGDAGNRGKVEAYPSLLVPILQIDQQLQHIQQLLVVVVTPGSDPKTTAERDDRRRMDRYTTVMDILQQPQYDIIAFKRIFNAYADNIYYSDPDRANVYLGGGGTFPLRFLLSDIYMYIYILLVPHGNSQRIKKKQFSPISTCEIPFPFVFCYCCCCLLQPHPNRYKVWPICYGTKYWIILIIYVRNCNIKF
jgi:hypothetical protein